MSSSRCRRNRGKSPFVDLDEKLFREVVELNLMAGLVTRPGLRTLLDSRGHQGQCHHDVVMASYKPLSASGYSAAKSGVLNLTEVSPKSLRLTAFA